MANLHLEIIRFFLKKQKTKQNKANEITKERILPRNMPKTPLFVIDCNPE